MTAPRGSTGTTFPAARPQAKGVAREPAHRPNGADAALTIIWRSATSRLLMSAIAAFSLLLLAVGFATGSEALRLTGVFGALIFGVGAAPLQLAEGPLFGERVGIAVMLGLSISSLVGAVLVLAPLWHPYVATALLVAAAAAGHSIGVARAISALRRAGLRVRRLSVGRSSVSARVSTGLAIGGAALSLGAALALGHIEPGIGGFLPRISPAWYVGLVMLLAAIPFAHDGSEARIALPVLLIVGVVTLTPAMVYGEPESQSAVKHVLLVQQILAVHRLHPGAYLYYAYSGFFDAIAWLCRITNVANPIGLATYWPMLIGLLGAFELRFLLGRVIRSGRRCWIGVMIALFADAVGQNYFSPQSEAFVIALGVFALVIVGRSRLAIPERALVPMLVVAGVALAVTHELTPYLGGGVLVVLAVFRVIRPRWAALALLVPAGAWALLHLHAVSGFVTFSSLGNLSNFKPPARLAAPGLVREAMVGISTDALVLGVLILIALALIGFVRNRGRGGSWGFIIAAGVGLVFIAINPYGDEGIFRATLFGIPWLTMIGLAAVRKPRWRWAGLAVVLSVMLGCYLVSNFGLDATNVVRANDVRVLDVYARDAPPGSYHLEIAADGDLPTTLDPRLHNLQWDPLWSATSVYEEAVHSTRRPTAADLLTLTRSYIAYARNITATPASKLFAVYSPTAQRYSVEYALETTANSHEWLHLFLVSPLWKLVYSSDGAYLFRYGPHGAAAGVKSSALGR